MATAVVSGRVDEAVRDRAAGYIRAAGLTAADVIKAVWDSIAATGEVPLPQTADPEERMRCERFASFMALRASLPACPELAAMDQKALREEAAQRYEGELSASTPGCAAAPGCMEARYGA